MRTGIILAACATMVAAAGRAGAQSMIVSGHVPLCMDVANAKRDAGTPLITFFCNGGANQQFTISRAGEVRVYGDRCLDASGGKGNDGDKVIIWSCTGAANQKWRVARNQLVGINNKCMDIKNGSILPWGEVILYKCTGGNNQKWGSLTMRGGGTVPLQDMGKYKALSDAVVRQAQLTNAAPFTMPIGNNVAQVTPLNNSTP
jgi:hypothetical protein